MSIKLHIWKIKKLKEPFLRLEPWSHEKFSVLAQMAIILTIIIEKCYQTPGNRPSGNYWDKIVVLLQSRKIMLVFQSWKIFDRKDSQFTRFDHPSTNTFWILAIALYATFHRLETYSYILQIQLKNSKKITLNDNYYSYSNYTSR